MKLKTKFFSLYSSFTDSVTTKAVVSLGNPIELPVLFKKMGWRLLSTCFPKIIKFNGRLRQLHNFAQHVLKMRKHHGDMFVVKYLKASQLAISKAIAGNPFKSLNELEPDLPLPRLATCGLPGIIPRGDRRAILSGSSTVIRWWETVFGVFRILQVPGKTKLETIVAPYSGDVDFLRSASVDLSHLFEKFAKVYRWKKPSSESGLLFLESSSPNFSVSWLGFSHDLQLLQAMGLSDYLFCLINSFWGPDSRLLQLGEKILHLGQLRKWDLNGNHSGVSLKENALQPSSVLSSIYTPDGEPLHGRVGQLSFKEEAAGKVRVFAMVDIWTQTVLKPLHDAISEILRSLPNDGTFDQRKAVERCFAKCKNSGFSYGYDLSAATDRLPIALQVSILSAFIGPVAANAWNQLLIERDYCYEDTLPNDVKESKSLRYAVGQPMGALSSFNMLALTHHLIVQHCAIRALVSKRGSWWDGYELLGDDIVLFDHRVAAQYLSFMEGIGMAINVKKSVVAKNETFEFAKVTGHNGVDVSAISWKMFISQNSFIGRANIAFNSLKRGIGPVGGQWLWNVLRHRRYTAGDLNLSLVAVFSMFAGSGFLALDHFLRALISLKKGMAKPFVQITEDLRVDYIRTLMSQCLSSKDLGLDTSHTLDSIWTIFRPHIEAVKMDQVRRLWNKYFESHRVKELQITKLVDRICTMAISGFESAHAGAPEGVHGVDEMFDAIWWDIYDMIQDHFMPVRRMLDHVGLDESEKMNFEELEKAIRQGNSLEAILSLPDRAATKLRGDLPKEVVQSTTVDSVSWLSAARRDYLQGTSRDWHGKGFTMWITRRPDSFWNNLAASKKGPKLFVKSKDIGLHGEGPDR